jgi:hypothetical protein
LAVSAFALQFLDFPNQHVRVDHCPVADDADGIAVKHAGGHQVELEDVIAVLDGMPRVASTLAANHHVGLGGKQVGNFRLAFIAPLGANYYHIGHGIDSSGC